MNHELVHVANLDAWNQQDKKWRRFFFSGKPRQTDKHPETIIYNYLRHAAYECAAMVYGRCCDIHGDLDVWRHWPGSGRI